MEASAEWSRSEPTVPGVSESFRIFSRGGTQDPDPAFGVLDPGVTTWRVGERVGVGFLNGHCGVCDFCRRDVLDARRVDPWVWNCSTAASTISSRMLRILIAAVGAVAVASAVSAFVMADHSNASAPVLPASGYDQTIG